MKGNQKKIDETEGDYTLSRSEKKRRARGIEDLAGNLLDLTGAELAALPAERPLLEELRQGRSLKGPARKRQLKYIARLLRECDAAPLYEFLEKRQGSRLRQARDFQQLERLRDDIINEAIAALDDEEEPVDFTASWQSPALDEAVRLFPRLDSAEVRRLAIRYARSRYPVHRREIFRLLHAAHEKQRFAEEE
ncbi:MAG: ribosome biogenesis factor YjgA [Thermodesulfobacteriota bacterium]